MTSKRKPKSRKKDRDDLANEVTPEAELAQASEDAARPMGLQAEVAETGIFRDGVATPLPLAKPEPTPILPVKPPAPKIHLRVFHKIAGPKWDQLAGFMQYAKANKLGPMTVVEWREALQA